MDESKAGAGRGAALRHALPGALERADLQPALAPTIPEARTLPAAAYVSAEVFAWELERFFAAAWVCVGRAGDLARPGDQQAVGAGDGTVLLVRGADGTLRGFHNVCRHRGHELLACGERRHGRAIVCPYHSWAYGLDGRLAGAPRFADMPGFGREDYPLVAVPVAEWHGWVFVNLTSDAPPFDEWAGNLGDLVGPWEPARLVRAARHDYVVGANWKTVTENYHECYHCPSIHPELCRVTPPDSGMNLANTGVWIGGLMELREHAQTMSVSGASAGVPIRGLSEEQSRQVFYLGLLPNLLISLHPDYVLTHRLEPISTTKTRVECEWLFPPEAIERPAFDPAYAVEFWDLTNKQDWAAVESVTRGLASRGARQGPFAWTEDEVKLFMATIARGYLAGRLGPPEPAHGQGDPAEAAG